MLPGKPCSEGINASLIIIIGVTRESLLADARTHFEMLTCTPDDLLRHIGSPFVPDKRPDRPQADAA